MNIRTRLLLDAPSARGFDVICAGAANLSLAAPEERRAATLRLRPGGGAVNAALALTRRGLRVGLSTAVADDSMGRALVERVSAAGVDTGGVTLGAPRAGLLLVEGGAALVAHREEDPPVTVPEGWTAEVLLIAGVSPAVAHGASLCKAARAARRARTLVVMDLHARWHVWKGQDSRVIRSVLREADVVRCRAEDLFVLNLPVPALRAAMRPDAVLVTSSGTGEAWASGPFGEVTRSGDGRIDARIDVDRDEGLTAAICAELSRGGEGAMGRAEVWARVIQGGRAGA